MKIACHEGKNKNINRRKQKIHYGSNAKTTCNIEIFSEYGFRKNLLNEARKSKRYLLYIGD